MTSFGVAAGTRTPTQLSPSMFAAGEASADQGERNRRAKNGDKSGYAVQIADDDGRLDWRKDTRDKESRADNEQPVEFRFENVEHCKERSARNATDSPHDRRAPIRKILPLFIVSDYNTVLIGRSMHRCLRLSSAELSSTSPIGKHGPMVMRSSHQSHGMPTEGPQSRNIAGARQWPWTSRPPLRREPSALDLSTSGGHSCGCPFGPPRIASVWRHQRSRPGPNGQPPESSHLVPLAQARAHDGRGCDGDKRTGQGLGVHGAAAGRGHALTQML
jgi:hypothetical protein